MPLHIYRSGVYQGIASAVDFGGVANMDGIPKRLGVLALPAGADVSLPLGAMLVYSGWDSEVPSGWHLADGAMGTNDLSSLFIVG